MKLTYWYAGQDDSLCYNYRAKTKKEVVAFVEKQKISNPYQAWSEPRKVAIEYKDAFDLAERLQSERGYEHGLD